MKKKKELDKLFYYIRDPHNRPVVTVCLLDDGDMVARGVAICSNMDQPCRKTGRSIAAQRAQAAMDDCQTRLTIATKRAKGIMKECSAPRAVVKSKSVVAEEPKMLSAFERKLLAKAKLARETRPCTSLNCNMSEPLPCWGGCRRTSKTRRICAASKWR